MPFGASPADRKLKEERRLAREADAIQTAADERKVLSELWLSPQWAVLEISIYRRQQIALDIIMNPSSSDREILDARAAYRELNWVRGLRESMALKPE